MISHSKLVNGTKRECYYFEMCERFAGFFSLSRLSWSETGFFFFRQNVCAVSSEPPNSQKIIINTFGAAVSDDDDDDRKIFFHTKKKTEIRKWEILSISFNLRLDVERRRKAMSWTAVETYGNKVKKNSTAAP